MAAGDIEQWVNMEKKPLFVEDEVTDEKRLGPKITFECKFEKAKLANFKVRLVQIGSKAVYTKKERGRNKNFKIRDLGAFAKPEAKGKDVKLEVDKGLPCAGGNRFQIEAKYKGTVVESKKVLAARRRLFYQILSMQGISPHSVAGLEQDYWDAAKFYFIKLKEKGARGTIKFIKTIHQDNYEDFIKAAKASYSIENRRPYAFTLVFSNLIADYGEHYRHIDNINIALPSRIFSWGPAKPVETKVARYIWYNMDPAHDKTRFWLEQNRTRFVPADGSPPIPISDSDLEVVGPPAQPMGGYNTIKIWLSPKLQKSFSSRKGVLEIDLKLRIVDSWTLGFSFNGINLITVANYVVWKPTNPAGRAQTLNHEFGHKIGMTASGQGFLPDAPPTYYKDSPACNYGGHRGPHCSLGTVYDPLTDSWSGAPKCVMFGADGAYVGGVAKDTPKDYCPACEKIVRKLDLDPHHLNGFSNSVMDY